MMKEEAEKNKAIEVGLCEYCGEQKALPEFSELYRARFDVWVCFVCLEDGTYHSFHGFQGYPVNAADGGRVVTGAWTFSEVSKP
jgi:hypothetical protein